MRGSISQRSPGCLRAMALASLALPLVAQAGHASLVGHTIQGSLAFTPYPSLGNCFDLLAHS